MLTRILIVAPSLHPGGAQRHFVNLAKEFHRAGAAVTVALLRREGAFLKELSDAVDVVGLLSPRLLRVLHWSERGSVARSVVRNHLVRVALYASAGAIGRLRRVCLLHRPAIVLSTLWEADVSAALALRRLPRASRPRWIVAAAFNFEPRLGSGLRRTLLTTLVRRTYGGADLMVAPSAPAGRQIRTLVRDSRTPVRIIPNAIGLDRVREQATRMSGWHGARGASGPVLVAVGRLVPEKGFDLLLQALARVRLQMPTARLVIVGDGPSRVSLERLARRLGIEGAVSWTGFLDNPFPYMAAADAVVVPSRWETFANVVPEAMALGVPVIATRCGGPEDILEPGRDGFLVPPEDVEALSRCVLEVLGDQDRRRAVGERARKKAEEFSASSVAAAYLKCFEQVLASGESP
ncbi:MAG: hypothetical protein AUH42_05535 [Gemmatimonadetes bacterium 13_1_40CM_70_11]|nr:MAG: hypothetical protein AUH42_05535 [Gemmatimonadetes bacterium 13_1_40CM_70_11]OLC76947.1 MAG: hypothetical protein AUH78_05400 [Gemmatimonadetes bacterium 13_1_40CM_4_69_8]